MHTIIESFLQNKKYNQKSTFKRWWLKEYKNKIVNQNF